MRSPRHIWCGVAVGAAMLVVSAAAAQPGSQIAPSTLEWLAIPLPDKRPEANEASIAAGKRIYDLRCSPCHGVTGDGKGPVAPFLDPRPRDFTQANFKLRTTKYSELPLDDDLFRTITRGIPGTAMPSWAPLTTDERFQVIYYVKTLSDLFTDPAFDPYREEDGEGVLVAVPKAPEATPELLEYGREVFLRGSCPDCHGDEGRGDGTSAGKQFTYLKHRILPRDLRKGWRYKGGTSVPDIWRTLTAGLNGTPMPSFIGSLNKDDPKKDEADRWAVALYVRSIIEEEGQSAETLLKVRRVEGALPTDPDDPVWDGAHEIHFRMQGQVTRRPRWQTPAVDHMRVRALYNESDIAFRLEYDDRTESLEHSDPDILTEETNYPELDVREYAWKTTKFADAVALQFPAKKVDGASRPYFVYGQVDKPVVLWHFRADRPGESRMRQLRAKGPKKVTEEAEASGALAGEAKFAAGQWRVVFKRALASVSPKDVDFERGEYIPFVVMAWDGGNGESGRRQSISSWYNLQLEAPIPKRAYLFGILAALLVAAVELVWLRKARRGANTPAPADASAANGAEALPEPTKDEAEEGANGEAFDAGADGEISEDSDEPEEEAAP